MDYNILVKNLKKDFSQLKVVKIAILGDSATQMITNALKAFGFEKEINFEIFEADYNQIERQIYDSESDFFQFNPEFVIIYYSSNKLLKKFYTSSKEEKSDFASRKLNEISNIYQTINSNLKCKTIFFNFIEINDKVFGNFANKINHSFLYQIRKLNFELMNLSQLSANLFINDISSLHSSAGSVFCFDPKMYVNADIHFSLDFLPLIAKNITEIILSIKGSFKKCLILDLDNTLWGGIIGDDGVENIQIGDLGIGKAYTELQMFCKQLQQRGIILAVCSKNDEIKAKEPFEKHPDMVLKLGDIAVFVANWQNKADNIRYIQKVLNIGFDSMIFLDDNPFERSIVKTNIPEVTVPDMPEDPAEYLPFLRTLNLFEAASYTEEDEQRTQQYKENTKRIELQNQFANEDDFLKNIGMVSTVKSFDKFTIPRIAQLSQRSNQFNLRTIRYSEAEIQQIAVSKDYYTFTFTLEDKFGDNGLISVVILQKENAQTLFIETWFMSCRVLKRGMENFVLNTIAEFAKKNGFINLKGEYLPTAKNEMVKDHYLNLGFINKTSHWELNLDDYKKKINYIFTK